MNFSSEFFINKLGLKVHPEGGYFKEVIRARDKVEIFKSKYNTPRSLYSSIYFLLKDNDFSAFHRLKSDEIWHYYEGNTVLEIIIIEESGKLRKLHLGKMIDLENKYQVLVPCDLWFAARLVKQVNSFVLVGCTVIPGFDYNDFELAHRDELTKLYPQHKELIESLTID